MMTFGRVCKREAKRLWADKKALLFFVAVPLVYALLFGFMFGNHVVNNVRLAVIDPNPCQMSREIIQGFDKSARFNVDAQLTEESEALAMLEQDKIDGVLMFPVDFGSSLSRNVNTTVMIGLNGGNSIIGNSATSSAMEIVKNYSAQVAIKSFVATGAPRDRAYAEVMPISATMRPWFNPQYSYLNYLLLGIVTVALQQLFMMTAANAMAKEKDDNTFAQLLSVGRSPLLVGLSKFLFYWLGATVIMMVTYAVTIKVFAIPFRGAAVDLLLLGIFFAAAVIGGGMCIGLVCQDDTNATQWVMLLAYPSFLITGYTWPAMVMPSWINAVAQFFPLTHIALHARNLALIGYPFEQIRQDLIILIAMATAALIATLTLFLWQSHKVKKSQKQEVAAS